MQNRDRPVVPNGPSASLLYQEDRAEKLREEDRLKEDEARRDMHDGQRAVDLGQDTFTLNGRRIRGRGRNPMVSAIYPYSHGRTVADDFAKQVLVTMAWGQFFLSVQEFYERTAAAWAASHASQAGPAGTAPKNRTRVEETEYEYGEIFVSRATYEQLQEEQRDISGISYLIAASIDPWEENDLRDKRTRKLDEYDMRLLPDESGYVHCQTRVEQMEAHLNEHMIMEQVMPVLVYRIRTHNHDGMRVYAKIGDAYNDDPVEAVASGDHLKVEIPVRPIPPPNFNFDG